MKQVLLAAVIPGPEHYVVSVGPIYIQVYLSDIWTVFPPYFPKNQVYFEYLLSTLFLTSFPHTCPFGLSLLC